MTEEIAKKASELLKLKVKYTEVSSTLKDTLNAMNITSRNAEHYYFSLSNNMQLDIPEEILTKVRKIVIEELDRELINIEFRLKNLDC